MDNTPLASKTTVSSRNKMAAMTMNNKLDRIHLRSYQQGTTTTTKPALRTALKPPLPRKEQPPTTTSRIALSRSRLSGTTATSTIKKPLPVPLANGAQHLYSITKSRTKTDASGKSSCEPPSIPNSRSSSKVSSISNLTSSNNNNNVAYNNSSSRQSSFSNAQTTLRQQTKSASNATSSSSYIPDTNAIRKGLAKFSNPIECQRQFQALNSRIRQLTEINENKDLKISQLQESLTGALAHGVGYATVVQYFADKLKIHSKLDLERECEMLKRRVDELMANELEYENKLSTIVADFEDRLEKQEQRRASLLKEYDAAKVSHSEELSELKDDHRKKLDDLNETHSNIKCDLENRLASLESELETRTKELSELRMDYEQLSNNFNKLEESLTKDKDARVKYAQEKINQLQKDVDSLNSVLEMKTERIHALEKDSILLGEVQQELMTSQDHNKALKQQLESVNAALENKRLQYETLLADHDKMLNELKRERKERRRMTMRTEQLEYALNESCANENNINILDSSVET